MPSSILGGIFFVLMGLGAAGLGIYLDWAMRPSARSTEAAPRRPSRPAETRLWLVGWALLSLGLFCFGMSVLRFPNGYHAFIPPSAPPAGAPLIDQIIWVLTLVGVIGGLAAQCVGAIVRQIRDNRLNRAKSRGP